MDKLDSPRLEEIAQIIIGHIEANNKILVYGDYDTDGVMGLKIFLELFKELEVDDVAAHRYQHRTHELDHRIYHTILLEQPDLVIIIDTGSSDISLLKKIKKKVKDIVIIDHHETDNFYSDFEDIDCYIFNNYLDKLNKLSDIQGCGGTFSALVAEKILEHYIMLDNNVHYLIAQLATIAHYSDVIDPAAPHLSRLYELANKLRKPKYLETFHTQYQSRFTKRFITNMVAPLINGTFRWENFSPLNSLFLENDEEAYQKCYAVMETIRSRSREIVNDSMNYLSPMEIGDFVVVNLEPLRKIPELKMPEKFLENNKGRFASKIADYYQKPCLAFCDAIEHIEGSGRDIRERDIRSLLRFKYYAKGHASAFGIRLSYPEYNELLQELKEIELPSYSVKYREIDMVNQLNIPYLTELAYMNEFTNQSTNPTYCVNYKFLPTKRYTNAAGYSYLVANDGIKNHYLASKEALTTACMIKIKPYLTDILKLEHITDA